MIAVTLIASLAWYAGHTNLYHKVKSHRLSPGWTVPRPSVGAFFSSIDHRRNRAYASVTPSTPAWQSTAYAGEYPLSSSTEMHQQQFSNQAWDMGKPGPMTSIQEPVNLASTYVPPGDDYGLPRYRNGEPGGRWDTSGLPPVSYRGFTAGQNEGLGLLDSNDRFVGQQREISRKPVPRNHNDGRIL
jgi:hypothetical protein